MDLHSRDISKGHPNGVQTLKVVNLGYVEGTC
jgi:hypothetical protein